MKTKPMKPERGTESVNVQWVDFKGKERGCDQKEVKG